MDISLNSFDNSDYIESVKAIQNAQTEMMQVLLDVKNEVLSIRHELSNKSENVDKPTEKESELNVEERNDSEDENPTGILKMSQTHVQMHHSSVIPLQPSQLFDEDDKSEKVSFKDDEKQMENKRESLHLSNALKEANKNILKQSWRTAVNKINMMKKLSFDLSADSLCLQATSKGSFQKFVITSIDCNTDISKHVQDWGKNDLCPLVLGPDAGCIRYEFPTSDKGMNAHELVPYCFPCGLKIHIIPRYLVDRATQIGWLGNQADEYQLHAFHSGTGERTHGISIMVKEEVDASILEMLKVHRIEHRAALKIQAFLRNDPVKQKKPINKSGSITRMVNFISRRKSSDKESKNDETKVSRRSLELASESYQAMIENSSICDVFIIEQCYTILGIDPDTHSLMFSALQTLVDFERESKLSKKSLHPGLRHQFVIQIQSKLKLNSDQSKVCHPLSELKQVSRNREAYKIEFRYFPKIPYYLPLPQISSEWGVAQLLFKFKLRAVLNVLMLLLLEHSVLVIGDSYEEVSSCSLALLDLLKPYKWASVFIPVLPEEMIEFVSSPVPYVIGVVARDKAHLKKIENNFYVKQHLNHGLNIINVTSRKIQWTQETNTKVEKHVKASYIISHAYGNANLMIHYDQRLEQLAQNESSSLNSFKLFFQNGASPKESVTLNSIKSFIEKNFLLLSGVISQRNDGWLMCTEHDDCSDELVYSDEKFQIPLIHLLEFQRFFSRTQLLSCYYQEKKNNSESLKVDKTYALLIADWVYFRWWKYQQRNHF